MQILGDRAGGRAFAIGYPGATPELLTRTWFPILQQLDIEDFTGNCKQITRSSNHCLSTQNLHCEIGRARVVSTSVNRLLFIQPNFV